MARSRNTEEDAPVDPYGRPLPLVRVVKDGVELEVRDAAALSNLHYGQGFDFQDGMTYHQALAELLGERAHEFVVEVPPEGGDVVWPHPGEDDVEVVANGGDGEEGSGAASGDQKKGKKADR